MINIKSEMRSFKSNENIHKKEGGSYYEVSANKAHQWPCIPDTPKIENGLVPMIRMDKSIQLIWFNTVSTEMSINHYFM